jgi:hypothetical protein
MQDVAPPSLADSADKRHGLKLLSDRFTGYALAYANDLHNAMPASGAGIDRTPCEGLLGRQVTLGVFRRFSCRCWVHTPGKPFVHRQKFEPRARLERFLGFDQLFGSGIYKVLLASGAVTQSQTVVFDDAPHVPPPVILPEEAAQQHSQWAGKQAVGANDCESSSEDEVEVHPLVPVVPPVAPSTGRSNCSIDSTDEVELQKDLAVTAVPLFAPTAQPASHPPIEDQQSAQAADHQPTELAAGRTVPAMRTLIRDKRVQL